MRDPTTGVLWLMRNYIHGGKLLWQQQSVTFPNVCSLFWMSILDASKHANARLDAYTKELTLDNLTPDGCETCGLYCMENERMLCAKCRIAFYCSKRCARADIRHPIICNQMKEIVKCAVD